MLLSSLEPTDTRALFRPVSSALVELLHSLPPDAWGRPTIAGTWAVRDVAAHLVDLTFRRLSFHRDRMPPPPPPIPIASERDFVRFINLINEQWIGASKRFSTRVLTDLLEKSTGDLADWFEALPSDAAGLFGVSWAGEQVSEGWFDVGREFTELWHHQQQIRMAVGAEPLQDHRHLRAVIEIALRGLPHAYKDVAAQSGAALVLDVGGDAGGQWTLARDTDAWTLRAGAPPLHTTRVSLSDETLWKLLFNAVPERDAPALMSVEGDQALAAPLVRARSVIV